MNGLEIGKAIYNILEKIDNVKIYPLVADKGATFPFITYRRVGLQPATTKDRFNYQELATVEIIVASSNYREGVEVTNRVLGMLEKTRGKFNDITISEIKLIGATEDFIDDTFIQKLTFNIEIL